MAILSEHPVRRLRFDGQEVRVPRLFGAQLDSCCGVMPSWNKNWAANRTPDEAVTQEPPMESFPVDIDAEQVVRWIMAEEAVAPLTFRTTARRTTEVREIPARREYHLGDEEREDLSEVATLATLEIAPAHAGEGWLLTVTVEDEIGPRVSGAGAAAEAEQQIDIGTFYSTFIRPQRGTANVVAEVAGPSARANVTRLLDAIERNRHVAARRPSKA